MTSFWYWLLFAWVVCAAIVVPMLWWAADHAPILDEDDLDDLTYEEWCREARA